MYISAKAKSSELCQRGFFKDLWSVMLNILTLSVAFNNHKQETKSRPPGPGLVFYHTPKLTRYALLIFLNVVQSLPSTDFNTILFSALSSVM